MEAVCVCVCVCNSVPFHINSTNILLLQRAHEKFVNDTDSPIAARRRCMIEVKKIKIKNRNEKNRKRQNV